MYNLRLIKGLSYNTGAIFATVKNPIVSVEDKKTADYAVSSGYFELFGEQCKESTSKNKFECMTSAELKVYANENKIDITDCKTKSDKIQKIQATLNEDNSIIDYSEECL